MVGAGGDADADGEGESRVAPGLEGVALHGLPDALGHADRGVVTGADEHDGELVASVAGERIDVAHALLEHACQAAQGLRADQVAVDVVDVLETVEVEEEDRQGVAVALRALDLVLDRLEQIAGVVGVRHVVDEGPLLGHRVRTRVGERRDAVAGHDVSPLDVLGGEHLAVIEQDHHARLASLAAEGGNEQCSDGHVRGAQGVVEGAVVEHADAVECVEVDRLLFLEEAAEPRGLVVAQPAQGDRIAVRHGLTPEERDATRARGGAHEQVEAHGVELARLQAVREGTAVLHDADRLAQEAILGEQARVLEQSATDAQYGAAVRVVRDALGDAGRT